MKTRLKDWPKVYEKMKDMRGMDEHERILFARFAAATPDEPTSHNERGTRVNAVIP